MEADTAKKSPFSPVTDAVTRIVFENLRNTVVCGTVGVAGLAVSKYHELSFIGPEFAPWISWGLIVAAACLVFWNIIHGFTQVVQMLKPENRFVMLLVFGPLFFLYMTAGVTVFGSIAKLQVHSMQAGSSSVQPTAKAPAQAPSAAAPKP